MGLTHPEGEPPQASAPHEPRCLLLLLRERGMEGEKRRREIRMDVGDRGSHASDIHSGLVWGSPSRFSGSPGVQTPRTLSFYIPRAPARFHPDQQCRAPNPLLIQETQASQDRVPGPTPLGTQESRPPVLAPSATQAPTFECI